MVEFAILLPLFLLILGGIIDGGRAFLREIELTNAAREGARMAVIDDDFDKVEARAKAAVPDDIADAMTVTLDQSCPESPGDTDVAEVNITLDFDWLILGPVMALLGNGGNFDDTGYTLDAKAVMRCGG